MAGTRQAIPFTPRQAFACDAASMWRMYAAGLAVVAFCAVAFTRTQTGAAEDRRSGAAPPVEARSDASPPARRRRTGRVVGPAVIGAAPSAAASSSYEARGEDEEPAAPSRADEEGDQRPVMTKEGLPIVYLPDGERLPADMPGERISLDELDAAQAVEPQTPDGPVQLTPPPLEDPIRRPK